MRRVILDRNVIVSAALTPDGACAEPHDVPRQPEARGLFLADAHILRGSVRLTEIEPTLRRLWLAENCQGHGRLERFASEMPEPRAAFAAASFQCSHRRNPRPRL